MEKKTKPTKTFTAGRVILSLWPNENFAAYKVKPERMFKRSDDAKWEYSDYLDERDLENLSVAAAEANNWIAANPAPEPAPKESAEELPDQPAA